MKKLSIEQKAQRYDEAIEKLRDFYRDYDTVSHLIDVKEELANLIPELKESKEYEDERIREALIDYLKERKSCESYGQYVVRYDRWIAWLKEQKTIDVLDEEEREFADNVDSYRKEIDAAYQKGFNEGVKTTLEKHGENPNNVYDKELSETLGRVICRYINEPNIPYAEREKVSKEIIPYVERLEKQHKNNIGISEATKRELENTLNKALEKETPESCNEFLKEQKSVGKAKPKFHEGEWVFIEEVKGYKNGPFQIKTVDSFGYSFDEYHTIPFMYEELLSKWTIQDAKDGDVIYSRHNTESFEWIGIFKSLDKENKRVFFYGFWHDMAKSFSVCGNEAYVLYDDFSLATKEQRDLLFQKMKEAGYEFDFEKKGLKKIVDEEQIKRCLQDNSFRRMFEKKPAWSEEDKDVIDTIIWTLIDREVKEGHPDEYEPEVNWLKSLKDRVQPKQEWSEEDKYNHNIILYLLNNECVGVADKRIAIEWFKSLLNNC